MNRVASQAPSPSSQAPASQAPASQVPASQPAATSAPASKIPGGVFITTPTAEPTTLVKVTSASQPSVATPSQQSQQPSSAPAPTSAAAPKPQPTGGSGTSSPSNGTGTTSTAEGSTCSTEGQWSCESDGKAFQRCASGVWSASIPVAAGTSCQPGLSDSLAMGSKRGGSGFVRRRRFVSDQFHQEREIS
jgi:hypothetical protein